MLLGLRQFAQESKLSLQVSHQRLSLVVMQRYARFQLLDLVELVNPFIRNVLGGLGAFNEDVRRRVPLAICPRMVRCLSIFVHLEGLYLNLSLIDLFQLL